MEIMLAEIGATWSGSKIVSFMEFRGYGRELLQKFQDTNVYLHKWKHKFWHEIMNVLFMKLTFNGNIQQPKKSAQQIAGSISSRKTHTSDPENRDDEYYFIIKCHTCFNQSTSHWISLGESKYLDKWLYCIQTGLQGLKLAF